MRCAHHDEREAQREQSDEGASRRHAGTWAVLLPNRANECDRRHHPTSTHEAPEKREWVLAIDVAIDAMRPDDRCALDARV